ncbi:MAG: methyltransferase domain-containing protein [Armatimonadota bacterium]|nr:methyltransferase domain-containing protein [Armatimonadota bacterium]
MDSPGHRFSFEKFSAHPFFRAVNAWLVEHARLSRNATVVDLGCGVGTVTEMILERLDPQAGALVYAIDPSPSALEIARARIRSSIVRFLQGTAERLSQLVPQVDAVLFCNAIHLVQEKALVCREVLSVLRKGGVFAFNTTFFEGAYPPETIRFYTVWVLRAIRFLRRQGIELARGVKTTAMRWLTPEQYAEMLTRTGFREIQMELHTHALSEQSLLDISEFDLFIEGALPGVPLEIGSQALQEGVRQTFQELGLTAVPRTWLQVIASRA